MEPAETLGEPSSPTGCRVVGDLDALYAGHRVDLVLKPTVTALDGFVAIRITAIPPTMTTARIVDGVNRACQAVDLSLDVVDVQDASRNRSRVDRVVEVLGVPPGARQSLARALEASTELELSSPTQYELPIVDMVRSWLRATGERFDPHAARTLLGLR